MLLLPPILTDASARDQAQGIVQLRTATGYEVFPENPPGQLFLGNLSMLEYYARLIDYADTGFLLDCAHLAMYQHQMRREVLAGLEDFPLERIMEIHVAGGTVRDHDGFSWVDDDHTSGVLHDTWTILAHVLPRAPHLRAVVFECERQEFSAMLPHFQRLHQLLEEASYGAVQL